MHFCRIFFFIPSLLAINMGSNLINFIADGVAATDAVSKLQMETAISDAIAAIPAVDAYTVAEADALYDAKYGHSSDVNSVAGRTIYIQAGDPGAIANGDIWHDLP